MPEWHSLWCGRKARCCDKTQRSRERVKKNDNIKTETVISVFRVWTEHIHRSTLLFVYKILLLLNIQIYATFLCIIIMPEPARWRTRSTLVIKSWRGQKWIVARQRCTSTHYEMLNKIRSTEAHYNTTTTSSAEQQQQQQQNRRKIYNIHMRMITKQAPQITQYDGMEIVISILINKSGQIWQRAYTTTTIGVETYNNSNNKSKQRRREIKKKTWRTNYWMWERWRFIATWLMCVVRVWMCSMKGSLSHWLPKQSKGKSYIVGVRCVASFAMLSCIICPTL